MFKNVTSELQLAYDSGVLDPSIHSRLAQNLDHYAQRANILKPMITMKMSSFACTQAEIAYVKAIKRRASEGLYGLMYQGIQKTPVMTRMMAIAGACLRNFIDARVMILQDVLAALKEGTPPDVSVLLIPNFFIAREEGGKIAEWHIAELLGFLYARMAQGQQTFIYVSNFEALKKTYGEPVALHLHHHFRAIDA
jgi:hypothetical protein